MTRPQNETATLPTMRARLTGVDASRGIALLGMMAVHALYAYDDAGEPTVVFSIAAGRAAALFATLAGVGVAFLTGRERVRPGAPLRSSAAALAARAAVIGGIGLVLGYVADAENAVVILPYYAVLFLLAIPLVLLGIRALLAAGAAIAIGMPVLSHLVRGVLPEPSGENLALTDLVTRPLGMLSELLLTGEYPVLTWAAYLCAGIAIGRMRLSSRRVAAGLLGAGAVLAATASAVSALLLGPAKGLAALRAGGTGMDGVPTAEILDFGADGVTPTTTWWWLAVVSPHTGTPLDLLHTTGTAVAVLGGALLLGHVTAPAARRVVDTVLRPVAAAGAMTLTLYTAHLLFINSTLDEFDPVPGYLLQVAAALLFALLWRRWVGRGPLEALAAGASRRAHRRVEEAVERSPAPPLHPSRYSTPPPPPSGPWQTAGRPPPSRARHRSAGSQPTPGTSARHRLSPPPSGSSPTRRADPNQLARARVQPEGRPDRSSS